MNTSVYTGYCFSASRSLIEKIIRERDHSSFLHLCSSPLMHPDCGSSRPNQSRLRSRNGTQPSQTILWSDRMHTIRVKVLPGSCIFDLAQRLLQRNVATLLVLNQIPCMSLICQKNFLPSRISSYTHLGTLVNFPGMPQSFDLPRDIDKCNNLLSRNILILKVRYSASRTRWRDYV